MIGTLFISSIALNFALLSRKEPTLPKKSAYQSIPNPTNPITPTPAIKLPRVYNGPQYTIRYPEGWKLQPYIFETGESLLIKPPHLAENEIYPSMNIVITRGAAQELSERDSFFTSLNFTKETVFLGALQTTKFSGETADTDESLIQETHIYFVKGDDLYSLDYRYKEPTLNDAYENLFLQMAKSFIFLQ